MTTDQTPPTPIGSASSSLRLRLIAGGLVLALAGGVGYRLWFASPSSSGPQGGLRAARNGAGEGPLPILASKAERKDVPVEIEGIGTVLAQNTVTVRPQVDGRLIALLFRDGDMVKAGLSLIHI